jgi:hypothetical protein
VGLGVFLILSPWLFGFASAIWWPHVLVGLTEIAMGALTRRRSPVELAHDLAGAGTPRR